MTSSDERYTPDDVLDVVRLFGDGVIACDPCTTADNRTRANTFCALALGNDGLSAAWASASHGVTFINPPYSRGQIPVWALKCSESHYAERIGLFPCDLGTRGGRIIAATADALCFWGGRIAFLGPDGEPLPCGAKQPSVFAYWGDRAKRFARCFSPRGVVWRR